ncbi:DUF1194 domain-containing protein [Ahrensia sp. 13_GOM-1096m]|uniref:DUF1194 domain-containing protein n=1 Tax=Ahrensia sp. 13_GOM-1096m TaxID=1380380 RepID=UPI000689137C|nr:DUF1194 domain-containing protein [Ahrensia sp. 13_GOM-1096m]
MQIFPISNLASRNLIKTLALFVGWLCLQTGILHASELEVDIELVLAVDVSSSMDVEEQLIQRSGYVAALTDPSVVKAIGSGLLGRIALTYVEWADDNLQTVIVPWRLIDGEVSARSFVSELDSKPLTSGNGTSISNGLLFASGLFNGNGFDGTNQVIDISGDGPNTLGPYVTVARDAVLAEGIIINGLPLLIQPSPTGYATRPNLADYYLDCVIGGPGSFVVQTNSMEEIATTIRRKLIQEIAFVSSPIMKVAFSQPTEKADCTIGQKDFHE